MGLSEHMMGLGDPLMNFGYPLMGLGNHLPKAKKKTSKDKKIYIQKLISVQLTTVRKLELNPMKKMPCYVSVQFCYFRKSKSYSFVFFC